MRVSLFGGVYLSDVSALLNLAGPRAPARRLKNLTRMAKEGRLKFPAAVRREIRRKDDRLKGWVDRHAKRCVIDNTDKNIAELPRISQRYFEFLKDKPGAADPVLIAMGVYYRNAGWIILTDDGGIQATCVQEGIQYVTSAAFSHLESI